MDSSEIDNITTLLNNNSSSGGGLFNFDSLIQSLMPFIIITTLLTLLFVVLYGIGVIGRWRANRAIIEIRDMIREMKDAQQPIKATPKVDQTPPAEPAQKSAPAA